MANLGKHLEMIEGIEMTKTLETKHGQKYHVVRRTNVLASVIVEGADELDFTLVSDGGGGLHTIEKGAIDTLVGWGADALKLGLKLMTGECKLVNHQEATFDPTTGNMTGFSNTTSLQCGSPS
jgi:hypothetical protein